jgi:DNA repair exonuclease SbcCD nuclease subunit
MGQLLKLSEAGIPTVIISGNHSTPRLRETGSVFRVFEHLKGINLAYSGNLERFEFGDLLVQALPHSADKELFDSELDSLRPDKNFSRNIAMLHAGVAGLGVFRMNEFNELLANGNQLERGFDYVALGHFHEHCKATGSAVYSGSTERLGFGEAGQPKGFVELEPESGKWKFREIGTRPMLDLPVIDCTGLQARDIQIGVMSALNSRELEGAIVRQRLKNADRKQMSLVDTQAIRKAASDALHFELRPQTVEAGQKIASSDTAFDSLEREFVSYLAKADLAGLDPGELERAGLEYLEAGGRE